MNVSIYLYNLPGFLLSLEFLIVPEQKEVMHTPYSHFPLTRLINLPETYLYIQVVAN